MQHLPNLLIVDDLKVNLILLKAITRELNVNLVLALSGAEALEKTRGMEIAMAIIDVQMPEMNGYEVALKINEERSGTKVPIIFMTAHFVNELEVIKGYEAGAADFLFKPINNHVLLSKINFFLDLYNQKQEISRNVRELGILNKALKSSEKKYRNYIDNAPDGIFIADKSGEFVEVNESACRITGYLKEELLELSIVDLITKESLKDNNIFFEKIVNDGMAKADLLIRHKNKSRRWLAIQVVTLDKSRLLCFAGDITERKRTEKELQNSIEQLRKLSQYIENVREDERKAISRELHDDLGQALTAVKIDLGLIRHVVPDKDVILKINKVSALVSETIKTVQRLTSQLRPEILDDLGIEETIEWYTKEFANRNGVEILLNIGLDISILPVTSLAVFRIMQESLTNIARHSKATKVEIGLNIINDNIYFNISDNGIGITEKELNSKKSFGIKIMKERVVSLGGSFEIYSENGTVIKLILPIKIH